MSNNNQNQGPGQQYWSGYPAQAQQPQYPMQQYLQQYSQRPQQMQHTQQPTQQYPQQESQQPLQQYPQQAVQQQYQQPIQSYGQQQQYQQHGQQHAQQQPFQQYAQQYSMQYRQTPIRDQGQQQQTMTTTTTTSSTNNQYQSMMQQDAGQQAVAQQWQPQQPMQNQYQVQQQNITQQAILNQYQAVQQQNVAQQQKKVQDDISRVLKSAAEHQRKTQATVPKPRKTSTTTTTTTTSKFTNTSRTERYEGEKAGGRARKDAESKGEKHVKNFEEKVALILELFIHACQAEKWYCMERGYLCSDGLHIVYHKDIDRAVEQPGHVPSVLPVNTFASQPAAMGGQAISWHPPQVDPEQPMHKTHRDFINYCVAHGYVSTGTIGCNCTDQFRNLSDAEAKQRLTTQGFVPEMEQHDLVQRDCDCGTEITWENGERSACSLPTYWIGKVQNFASLF